MKKNHVILFSLMLVVSSMFIYGAFTHESIPNVISTNPTHKGVVCVGTTGDFDGRISEPHSGISEFVGCNYNILTDAGAEAIEQALGAGASTGRYTYIGLCNASNTASAECTTPAEGDTSLDNEYGNNSGLDRANGTYRSISGSGYYEIKHTFTSNASNQKTNMTGLFNGSESNTMLAENTFTIVTLQSADQLTVNWSINISDSA